MIRDLDDLHEAHEWATQTHRNWKQRSLANDLIASGKWSTVWADLTTEEVDPLVENVYLEALEDKAAAAAGLNPLIFVAPSTGTRSDRGESQAQKKRKVFVSYLQRSKFEKRKIEYFFDWLQHGAAYAMPWTNWADVMRYPYFLRHDPRTAFPLAHNSLNELTAIFFSKERRWVDLVREYGEEHPALMQLKSEARISGDVKNERSLEEVAFYDNKQWGVAIRFADKYDMATYRYQNPMRTVAGQNFNAVWLTEPELHMLSRCPVVENRRATHDGEYRGALDVMIPNIRVAHNLMARVMEDVELQIGAPVLMENVENPEDYGPYAQLLGTGEGRAQVVYPRPPVNFEANQHIQGQMEAAKRAGKFPEQRAGEAGASIVSAKGVNALQGAYNTELAWSQRDDANFLQDVLSITAEFDAKWCPGNKEVEGFDQGEAFAEKYNPEKLFDKDYRVIVTFGGGLGLDSSAFQTQLAVAMNLGGLARRSFMQKGGLVDNPIQEEREIALQQIQDGFMAFVMSQADQGNLDPLQKIAAKIDDDKVTVRAAVMAVVQETFGVPAGAPGSSGGPGGAPDALLQQRSLDNGGIPGNAEGLPAIGGPLQGLLPSSSQRAMAQTAPGGNAT